LYNESDSGIISPFELIAVEVSTPRPTVFSKYDIPPAALSTS
jgi:hypothetical protein